MSHEIGQHKENPIKQVKDDKTSIGKFASVEENEEILQSVYSHEKNAMNGIDESDTIDETDQAPEGEKADPIRHELVVLRRGTGVGDATGVVVDEVQGNISPAQAGRRFFPPTREQVLTWLPFWGVLLLAGILRFWALGDKPMHHDESLHGYYSWSLMLNTLDRWAACALTQGTGEGLACYQYHPLLHGPFQFHFMAFDYKISQFFGVPDGGANNATARILSATLGTALVGLPYFLRHRIGNVGAFIASLLLAISPSMVYFARFAREDTYMAFFTLLLVVALARYVYTRKAGWLITAFVAFVLSYATKEATFLTLAVFGSFFLLVIVWELGARWQLRDRVGGGRSPLLRYVPRTGALAAVLIVCLALLPLAKFFFSFLHELAIFVSDEKSKTIADAYVENLKNITVGTIPVLGIVLGLYVLSVLLREMWGKLPPSGRFGRWADPTRQPILHLLLTTPWTSWFFAFLCGWAVFLILFTALFTSIRQGIGDGIWQGLYYWLEQQQVARGGQPWYYYLILIPFYEQIAVIFGLVGIVRCLVRPSRFRLFLVYWFVGNFFIYSWASEKMPWLMIHMVMPLILLAAIGLEPAVSLIFRSVRSLLSRSRRAAISPLVSIGGSDLASSVPARPASKVWGLPTALCVVLLAALTLIPTVHNMVQVSYINPADAPHEMMIYVQTSDDVHVIMKKIEAVDQKLYGGKREVKIGVKSSATWPFIWYLRNYSNVCLGFPTSCPDLEKSVDVIVAGDADSDDPTTLANIKAQYTQYNFHHYKMRVQWDQGYMPPLCQETPTQPCEPQPYIGIGPLLWLSYGGDPLPENAQFDLGRTATNIWQWWWERKPFGSIDGSYDMALLIRSDIGIEP